MALRIRLGELYFAGLYEDFRNSEFFRMSESASIVCPKCGTRIDLDDIAKLRYEEKLKADEERLREEFSKKEEEIKKDLREKAMEWADKKAAEKLKEKELETKDLVAQLGEFQKKQEESMKNELELRRRTRELEAAAKNAELESVRKLDEERKKLEASLREEQQKREEETARKSQEDFSRKLEEKEKQMTQLRQALDEANRKATQGSQQIQGEVLENELKEALTRAFPTDSVEDVPTGIRGADLIHRVRDAYGRELGIILWESKNTKAFSQEWVKKLKDDRIIAKADVCILVSSVVPEGIRHFGLYEGVWITEPEYFLPLTQALRDKLLALSDQGKSLVGREEKMELLYGYLSGPEFRAKIENVIGAFRSMKEDLESEKRSMQRIWGKREKELERIIGNTAMLYGDMQGIMGANLQSIEYLELGGPEASADEETAAEESFNENA
jgi:hypothetical protein